MACYWEVAEAAASPAKDCVTNRCARFVIITARWIVVVSGSLVWVAMRSFHHLAESVQLAPKK